MHIRPMLLFSPIRFLVWLFLSGICAAAFALTAYAQTTGADATDLKKLQFEHLSGSQGLPKTYVRGIQQDQQGFLWFATEDGLYRYDGKAATHFQADPAHRKNSLPSNYLSHIHEDRRGQLRPAGSGRGQRLR